MELRIQIGYRPVVKQFSLNPPSTMMMFVDAGRDFFQFPFARGRTLFSKNTGTL